MPYKTKKGLVYPNPLKGAKKNPKTLGSGTKKPSELQRKVMKGKSANQKVSGKFPRKGY